MRRICRISSKLLTGLSLLVCIFLTACGEIGQGNEGQLLTNSITALNNKEQYAFTGLTQILSSGVTVQASQQFEGFLIGGDQLFVRPMVDTAAVSGNVTKAGASSGQLLTFKRTNEEWIPATGQTGVESEKYRQWNPASKLRELEAADNKTVRYDHEQAKQPNEHVLLVELADPEMTTIVADSLKSQHSQLSLERQLELARTRGLSEAELGQLAKELQQVISRSQTSLDEMLGSLKAQGTYRLWIDRTTRLPRKLTAETNMTYAQGGAQRQETVRAEFEFKDYDKNRAIPQG
jgi:hypothetical protein